MGKYKVYGHGSYIGNTGYNHHTREFFRQLYKHYNIKFRNFTIGSSYKGSIDNPHDNELYLNKQDKEILHQQTLWTTPPNRKDELIYTSYNNDFEQDVNIVLAETNHHYFYDEYKGPKIAYNVWESTLQPDYFFNKLKEFDELWVPSEWQKECMVKQGYDRDRIQIVPEGVDDSTFFPEKVDILDEYKDGRFKFLLFGRWDYRKGVKEVIETFLKTFDKNEPIDLVVSIDNPYGKEIDGFETTEERLKHFGLDDPRVKILHFPSREDYVKYLKTGHVFVSCARSEGWNLPLIEAMACGTPSIYSDCSAQLEFAKGKGHPVKILGERRANQNSYARFTMSDLTGNYYEPDFEDLSRVMKDVYNNYEKYKQKAILDSEEIRKKFNWENIGKIGDKVLNNFMEKYNSPNYQSPKIKNRVVVSYDGGPKVEILGTEEKEYKVEFCNNDEVIYNDVIKNNMWTTCGRKYYTEWTIKINGKIVDKFNLKGKRVVINLDSKSIGDTIAWAPYAVEFAKKHDCKVLLSTFHNDWFRGLEEYKDIDFIEPDTPMGCYASYKIGWFRDDNGKWDKFDMYPNQVNLIPLQQTATDILGLDYKEVNHGLNFQGKEKPIDKDYIIIAPNATSGCKEWNYDYWVSLSKLIKDSGYEVIVLTQKPYYIKGVTNIWGESFSIVANYLLHAKAFIGLGSGLSWFNWGLNKHTYMINGFARPGHEFTSNITRIYNDNICIFCWNDEVFTFDAGDWDWCPVYKGTSKQHICQKSITSLQVFNSLKI